MKNLIFIACALCAVAAVPLPAAENSDLEVLQIPLEGNKVSINFNSWNKFHCLKFVKTKYSSSATPAKKKVQLTTTAQQKITSSLIIIIYRECIGIFRPVFSVNI